MFFKQKRNSNLFMTMITEKKLLGFWLFSLVVKYLFRVQVAPVRFREEPNIISCLSVFFFNFFVCFALFFTFLIFFFEF